MIVAAHQTMLAPQGAPLPYDAEVDYLESTGTQYVDTGVKPDDTTVFSAEGLFDYAASATRFGTRDSETVASFTFLSISSGFRSSIGSGSVSAVHGLFATKKNAKTIELDGPGRAGRAVFVDGTNESATSATSGPAFSCSHNFLLFAFNNGGTVALATGARISACTIVKSGVLVRSFIPVRVGTVGYLFDRVSGQLFGNAGTGAFAIGPDKT